VPSRAKYAANRGRLGAVGSMLTRALPPARRRPPRQPAPKDRVVFVCEPGAAKSVIAAAWFERIAAERGVPFHAIARGATPQPSRSVASVAGLRGDGLVPQPASPRPLTSSAGTTSRR